MVKYQLTLLLGMCQKVKPTSYYHFPGQTILSPVGGWVAGFLGCFKKTKSAWIFSATYFSHYFCSCKLPKKISAQSELIQGSLKSPIFSKNRPIGDNWTENALFALFTLVYLEVLKFERCGLKISVSNNVLVYLTNKKRIRLIS